MSRIGNRKLSNKIVGKEEKVSLIERVNQLIMGKLNVNDSFKLLSELVEGKSRLDNIEYSNAIFKKSENESILKDKKKVVEKLLREVSVARYPPEIRELILRINDARPRRVLNFLIEESKLDFPNLTTEYLREKKINLKDMPLFNEQIRKNIEPFIKEYEEGADDVEYVFQPGTQDDTEITAQKYRKAVSEYENMEKELVIELPVRMESKFEKALKPLCESDGKEAQSYPDNETNEAIDMFLRSASSALPPQDIVNLHNNGQPSIESMILRSLDHYPEAYAKLTSYQVEKVLTNSRNIISKQLTQLISEIEMLNNLTNAGLRPIYVCGLFSKHICGNARTIVTYWLTKSSTLITSDLEHLFKLQGIRDIRIGLPINFSKSNDDKDKYIEDENDDVNYN